jgi:integrase
MRRKAHVRFGGRAGETGEPKDSHCASARPNHTHASIAVKAGVPIGVVSERLGHASPEFTLHRYSHVMPGMQREAADTIARAVRFDAA